MSGLGEYQSDFLASEAVDPGEPRDGISCHQRWIRETVGQSALRVKGPLYPSETLRGQGGFLFGRIAPSIGARFIEKYEWLGHAGRARIFYGIWRGDGTTPSLYGVEAFCPPPFGVAKSFDPEVRNRVLVLSRGACSLDAGRNAGSMLIAACLRDLRKRGTAVVLAYSDLRAGETGACYRAAGAVHVGDTNTREKYGFVQGRWMSRNNVFRRSGRQLSDIDCETRLDTASKRRFAWVIDRTVSLPEWMTPAEVAG